MKDLAIFGAGGFGREVVGLINRINNSGGEWNFIGFFDDTKQEGEPISHFGKVLGDTDALNNWPTPINIVIAVGAPNSLFLIRNKITNPNVAFPNLIDPDFYISDLKTFSIGEGNIIQKGCVGSVNITIGNFNVLNGSVSMGHDDKVGDYNVIMPGVKISGGVQIGDKNLIGVGSIIIQNIKIGSRITLGAGAVLLTRPYDGNTYLGNPAVKFIFK